MISIQHFRERVQASLEATPYAHLAGAIAAAMLPAIYLLADAAEDDSFPVGTSKIGGHPDLHRPWPVQDGQALSFLAQFNLAELAPHDEDQIFPRSGLLSFFLGQRATEGKPDSKNFAVLYQFDLAGLKRTAWPGSELEKPDAVPAQSIEFRASCQQNVFDLDFDHDTVMEVFNIIEAIPDSFDANFPRHSANFLLGDSMYNDSNFWTEHGERVLFSLGNAEIDWPFLNGNAISGFVFFIPKTDLSAHRFDRIRLAYTAD